MVDITSNRKSCKLIRRECKECKNINGVVLKDSDSK